MNRKKAFFTILLCALVMCFSMTAFASWKKNSSGKWTWYNSNGKAVRSLWVSAEKAGLVWSGSKIYIYKKNGSPYHGFLTTSAGKTYFADTNGVVQTDKWLKLTVGGKKKTYRARENGTIYKYTVVKIGSDYYGFGKTGARLYGRKKIKGDYYYFHKSTGKMFRKTYIVTKTHRYYARSNGKLAVKKWVGKYYFGSVGRALKNGWVGDRYVGSDGKYLTGLKKIGSYYYYFSKKNGKKLTNTSMTVNGYQFTFDSDGRATVSSNYEDEYFTDPSTSTEKLLAAIIYCEAGNQPYYGQLAVGLVITNRMRSSDFPSSLKDVVYAKEQFTPARNGALTNALSNYSSVSSSAKKAAKKVLSMYASNSYTITVKGKKKNMQGYLFFMTPAAYARLGLSSEYLKLDGHVFFKTWG